MLSHRWTRVDRPLVFAHRGGARLAPENTIAAFDRAVSEGVDGLELDIRLSRDGEPVVCHDALIDRTSDQTGPVGERMASELARVDAGYRFSPGDGTHPYRGRGVGIPTLREVLARYPRHRLIVEMKDTGPEIGRALLAVVREAGAAGRVCAGSFHRSALRVVRRLEPGMATGAARDEALSAVMWSRLGWLPPFRGYQALQVPEQRENMRVVTPQLIRAAHRAGVPVQVRIVDEADHIRRLLELGVDAIISDRPDVAVAVVRAWIAEREPGAGTRSSAGRS